MRSTQMPQQLASEAGTPASPRNQVEEQAYVATGPDERSSAQLNEDKNSAAEPTHQLARQLAAEIEAKQRAASTRDEGAIALGQAPGPESPVISSPNNISSTTQTPPTLSSAKASQSPSRVSAGDVGPSKQLQKAASRISRIFRPNMGPRPQTSRKAEATSVDQVEQVVSDRVAPTEPGQYTDVGVGKVDPVMTLPKAPPRLTTDPLSTDNLRKLSRHQLRSPVTHRADSASTSSSEDDASTSSTSESDKSDTESDSADDESTKKPPSTVSFLGARAPPSLTASTVNGPESEREAAAASWRRTEDGRRHSALLSRPLSIKRKPPPVPPKRWGGVWDRDAIQEKLRKSFNLLEEEEREPGNTIADPTTAESWLSRARSLMPGTLPSVAEDEQAWEVVGQEPTATLVQPSTSWRTVGREENNPSLTDRVQSFLPRTPESSSWTARNRDYVYSEADFSTSRRPPPPPPPRFSASPQPALVNTLDNIGETLVTSSGTRPESPSRVLLQRSAAVRRPNSTLLQRQSFESAARRSPELVRSTPPSPEVRSRLGSRSRHVYSTSTPNASIMTQAPTAQQEIATHAVRRALPPIPSDEASTSSNTQSRSEDTRPPAPGSSSVITASDPPTGIPTQEYTDLEVMLASLDDSSPAAVSETLES